MKTGVNLSHQAQYHHLLQSRENQNQLNVNSNKHYENSTLILGRKTRSASDPNILLQWWGAV